MTGARDGCRFTQRAIDATPKQGDAWDDDVASVTFEWSGIRDYRVDDDLQSLLVHFASTLPYELVIEATDEESRVRWEAALAGFGVKKIG